MKIYSKFFRRIRKKKVKIKKTIGMFTVGIGMRYGNINPSLNNLQSDSTQQIERVNTFGKISRRKDSWP